MVFRIHGGVWWAIALVCAMVGLIPLFTVGSHDAVDGDRIAADVAVIAEGPHALGTPELEQVRVDIERMLQEAGLEPVRQEFVADDYFGVPGNTVLGVNILARIDGADSSMASLFVAHYDSVPTTPGANDNAAAVAALIEMARVIERPPPSDVILLLTDGEEPAPRYGANAFADHPWFDDVALAVNFEAIGSSGRSLLVEIAGPGDQMAHHLADTVPDAVAYSFTTDATAMLGEIGTDFDVFADNGIPGYHFAYARGSSIYHTSRDNIENLGVGGATDHAALALGLASAPIPDMNLADEASALFFTLPWGHLLVLPRIWATLLATLALAATVATVAIRRRRGEATARGTLGSAGWTLLGLVGGMIVATIAWIAITVVRPEMGVLESYVWLSMLLALVAGMRWVVERRGPDQLGGILVIWALFAVAATPWLPGLGLAYSAPVIVAALATLFLPASETLTLRAARIVPVALVVGVLMSPAIEVFFHFATPRPGNPDSEMAVAIIVPVALTYLIVSLMAATIDTTPSRRDSDLV